MDQQPDAPGAQGQTGGGSPPSNNATSLTAEQVRDIVHAAVAPIREEISRFKASDVNRKRQLQRIGQAVRAAVPRPEGSQEIDQGDEADPSAPPIESMKDPSALQAIIAEQEKRLRELTAAEDKRNADDRNRRIDDELRTHIGTARVAPDRVQFLFDHLRPRIREAADGSGPIYDDGKRVRRLDEVVREFAALDIFRPAAVTPGAGATNTPVASLSRSQTQIDQSLPPEVRIKLFRQQQAERGR